MILACRRTARERGFTIIELLIVVVIIGILVAAGVGKYQNFVEHARRKTCIGQLKTLDTSLANWETLHIAFGENAKTMFGFTLRTGTMTAPVPGASANSLPVVYPEPVGGVTVGPPSEFFTPPPGFAQNDNRPLSGIIRDDRIYLCPGALMLTFGGEMQNVPDTYADTDGNGPGLLPVGATGRYIMLVIGPSPSEVPGVRMSYAGIPTQQADYFTPAPPRPIPSVPTKMALCGCYGTANQLGSNGPDSTSYTRHSARW